MMNFNFIKNFGKVGKTINKALGYGLVLMFVVFTSASLSSLQAQVNITSASANEVLDISTVKEVIQALHDEVDYLTADMKNVPPTVTQDMIQLGSPFHRGIISAYNAAINNLINGSEVKAQMLGILQGPLFKGTSSNTSTIKPVEGIDLKPSQQQHLNNIIAFVRGWNLTDGDISDFNQTLMMIRELKN